MATFRNTVFTLRVYWNFCGLGHENNLFLMPFFSPGMIVNCDRKIEESLFLFWKITEYFFVEVYICFSSRYLILRCIFHWSFYTQLLTWWYFWIYFLFYPWLFLCRCQKRNKSQLWNKCNIRKRLQKTTFKINIFQDSKIISDISWHIVVTRYILTHSCNASSMCLIHCSLIIYSLEGFFFSFFFYYKQYPIFLLSF